MSGLRKLGWRAQILGLMPGVVIISITVTSLSIAIPELMAALALTAGQAQWVIVTYALAVGVVIPVTGWAGKRVGHKQALLAALALFTAGSALGAAAPNVFVLTLARILQGIAGGALVPLTMTIIHHVAPGEKLGSAMGIWSVTVMTSAALGPSLGGVVVQYLGWRGVFWTLVPVGILGLLLGAVLLDNARGARPPASKFDLAGFLNGRWLDRRGPRELVISGGIILVIVQFLFARAATGNDPTTILWLSVVRGLGSGLVYMPLLALGLGAVSRAAAGAASSLMNLIVPITGAIWFALLTGLFSIRLDHYSMATAASQAEAVAEATGDVCVALGITSLGILTVGLLIKAKPRVAAQQEPAHLPAAAGAAGSSRE